MKYWTRTTHNFNNETREWEFKNELADIKIDEHTPLGIHALDSGRWMSFREILDANLKYQFDFRYENHKKDLISVDAMERNVLHDLRLLEEVGLVKSKGE